MAEGLELTTGEGVHTQPGRHYSQFVERLFGGIIAGNETGRDNIVIMGTYIGLLIGDAIEDVPEDIAKTIAMRFSKPFEEHYGSDSPDSLAEALAIGVIGSVRLRREIGRMEGVLGHD